MYFHNSKMDLSKLQLAEKGSIRGGSTICHGDPSWQWKLILPDFSIPKGPTVSVPFPEVRNRSVRGKKGYWLDSFFVSNQNQPLDKGLGLDFFIPCSHSIWADQAWLDTLLLTTTKSGPRNLDIWRNGRNSDSVCSFVGNKNFPHRLGQDCVMRRLSKHLKKWRCRPFHLWWHIIAPESLRD